MWAITTLGSTIVVGPLFVIAEVALLRVKRRREALFLAIALIGSVIMNGLLKLVFQRPRPDLPWAKTPLDYSFPSGHTMNSLVFYLALALIAWVIWGPRVGIPATIGAILLAVLIGISRIYLGAHYFSDVVAGFIAGLAWLIIVSAGFDAGTWLGHWRSDGERASPTGRSGLTDAEGCPERGRTSPPGHDHRQCARPDRHRDGRRAGDAAVGLDQRFGSMRTLISRAWARKTCPPGLSPSSFWSIASQPASKVGIGPAARTTITSSNPSSPRIRRRGWTIGSILPKLAMKTWAASIVLRTPSMVISCFPLWMLPVCRTALAR